MIWMIRIEIDALCSNLDCYSVPIVIGTSWNRACELDEVNLKDRREIPAEAGMADNMKFLV